MRHDGGWWEMEVIPLVENPLQTWLIEMFGDFWMPKYKKGAVHSEGDDENG